MLEKHTIPSLKHGKEFIVQIYSSINEWNSNEVCSDFKFGSTATDADRTFNFNADQAADSKTRDREKPDRGPYISEIKMPEIPPAKWEEVNRLRINRIYNWSMDL